MALKHFHFSFKKLIQILPIFHFQPGDVILVGHSMGGALAVHAALGEKPIPNLVGLVFDW